MSPCPGCKRNTENPPCHQCSVTCARKREYPTYKQAKHMLLIMREQGCADDLLYVYHCPVRGDHYHLGHAKGEQAKRLLKRAAKRALKEAREAS